MQKRNLSMATVALITICFISGTVLGQSSATHLERTVIVKIKNGKPLRGTLIRDDKDSVRIEVEGVSCPIEIDKEEVAGIVFTSKDVAKNQAQAISDRKNTDSANPNR